MTDPIPDLLEQCRLSEARTLDLLDNALPAIRADYRAIFAANDEPTDPPKAA